MGQMRQAENPGTSQSCPPLLSTFQSLLKFVLYITSRGFNCIYQKEQGKVCLYHLPRSETLLVYFLQILLPLQIMYLEMNLGTSLVAQWLRICLPVQGTLVRALVQEDPTCRGTTNKSTCPVCATTTEPALQSPRATTTEPTCHNY